MQTSAREALDIARESAATKRLYGIDDPATADFGTRCLIARRLVERGVRFVQVFTRNQFWDHHGRILTSLPASCRYVDKPSAALVKDLKSRGLLDSTIVNWGGEMGRLPVIQNDTGRASVGRDHNTYGFTHWFAGGGFKGGVTYGATDDFGHHAVTDVVNHCDFHATVLHLFGLDHRRLAYRHNGQEVTLTDNQPARIVRDILS
jgi:arylsulfatase A-like enzyme